MTLDIYAIGTALAGKYATVTISDTTAIGGTAIRESTFLTPNNLAATPAVIIELPSGEQQVENNGEQQDIHEFDVYFLLDKAAGDIPRAKKALAKWIGPLREALYTGNQLGISTVLKARPVSWKFELYDFGGDEYYAWHLVDRVWTETHESVTT